METTFNIVFSGQFKAGLSRDDVLPGFATRFNISEEQAEAMLPLEGETILKRGVDEAKAEKFRQILDELGVVVETQPTEKEPEQDPAAVEGASQDDSPEESVAEDSAALQGQQFNPYAKVTPNRPAGTESAEPEEPVIVSQTVFEGAVAVPASRGISWITEGYGNHVKKSLGAWIGSVLLYVILSIVLSLIPFIGTIGLMLIGPVIMAGFMIGAKEQDEGSDFTFGHLFRGFDAPGQLMLLAVFYLVAMFVVVLVTGAIFGLSLFSMMDQQPLSSGDALVLLLSLLVMLALMLPVLMAYWFAPALVALEGLSALDAMKQSFIGCLKNIPAMLIYGVVGLVLMIIATLPLMLGLIFLMPVLVASMYVGYKDIYRSAEREGPVEDETAA